LLAKVAVFVIFGRRSRSTTLRSGAPSIGILLAVILTLRQLPDAFDGC
jgi:hypothetical protein